MLNKSISLSAQVNKLSLKHKILYTWGISHLDDYGLISNDPEVFKATVVPMVKEITVTDVNEFFIESEKVGLTKEWSDCLEYLGFENHQSITPEKRAKCHFDKLPKNPQEIFGENKNPQKSPVQEKGKEDKRREGKEGENNAATAAIPAPQEIFNHWNDQKIISHRAITPKIETKIRSAFKIYSLEEIKISISNYAEILKDDNYFWTYKWTLDEFLVRGLTKFLETPKDNFLKERIEKKKKPFYRGDPMVQKNGQWFVIKGGEWLEYNDKESLIEYK